MQMGNGYAVANQCTVCRRFLKFQKKEKAINGQQNNNYANQ